MKYRTKLYISLVGVAFASIVLGLFIVSTETEKLLFKMLQSRTMSIAATATANMDASLFAKINKDTKRDSPEYHEARAVLLRYLNANRRNDIYISELYTLYLDNDNSIYFGVETSLDPDLPGTVYNDTDKQLILDNWNTYSVDDHYVTDQYGVWLSAFSPIRDDKGNVVAVLGVDVNAVDIHLKLDELIKFGLWGLLSSIVLSFILAHFLSKQVTTSLDKLSAVVQRIEEGDLTARSELETNDEFSKLGYQINSMCKGLQERERLKMSFARYVSTHILDKILKTEAPLVLEGERRKVTLLFSDIRQFTQLAERLPPEEVVALLNEYFEQMIEVIFSQGGTLDKFIGDGIMAEFGAPLDDDKQEEHAVAAAIGMHRALLKLCEKWRLENKPLLRMGIGVHTGEAVVGNIGSERRTDYTAIGDAVNVAARLEQATKILKTPILISESTYLATKDLFPYKDLGSMALPGRREQIRVYTVEVEE